MKRFATALVFLGAGLAGCQAVDSRVAGRSDIVSESSPMVSDEESSPRPLPIVERWQKMIVKIRQNVRRPERSDEGMTEDSEVTSSPVSVTRRLEPEAENQSTRVTRSDGVVHHQKVKTLPSPTSVVQVGASQPALPSKAKPSIPLPDEPGPANLPIVDAGGSVDGAVANAKAPETTGVKNADAGDSAPEKIPVKAVNSKRIVLDYEIKDIGPSGISTVDLWYTRDGRKWEKCPAGAQRTSPYILEVKEEGLYGMTLVASSGIGLKKRPPRPGDNPQIWISVDVTKPAVRLTGCTVGTGTDADSLTITWKATDKHLGERPISLSYAEQADGPWSSIAANVENTGSYLWKMPSNVPQRLMVRLEATDLAGNVGIAQTRDPVLVDLSKPTVSILGIHSAGN
jgi:hypothetical protein